MAKIVLNVALPASKYEAMYSGAAKNLVASSLDGRKVQLPLSAFQRFLTHQGIYGFFEVEFDDTNKLVGVTQIR
ncbi:DUF2835 domain-containing protein [Marinomonas sp. CT5]|uniref:DUF2835 domain-containing protein n=1 Tax=Marinomonas sp. CT5 TaxID=2066133 RepID=UPI00185AD490|nr:DUF2835 domain-containing protein [Marinomonas sp. CT5]NVK74290.1 DUF2835 domain-containing protein [Oceanospirillaceae bacterium]QUX95458.1 DUF2835 domain-containing protein [Marinomonas sp. CT5]